MRPSIFLKQFIPFYTQQEWSNSTYKTKEKSQLKVYVGSNCSRKEGCERKRGVAAIHYYKDYQQCTSRNDIALVELDKKVTTYPICMPDKDTQLRKTFSFAGFEWSNCTGYNTAGRAQVKEFDPSSNYVIERSYRYRFPNETVMYDWVIDLRAECG
ncbi:hypothetical protein ANCCAN_07387, partial [Ancylostoma caninum]